MKHIKLFENWHNPVICPDCGGTGFKKGTTKEESIAAIIKNGTAKDFMEYIGDDDFIEHAAKVFKNRGVYTIKSAEMVAALKLPDADLKKIIEETEEGYEDMKHLISNEGLTKSLNVDAMATMKETMEQRKKVLAILRKK